MIRDLRIVLHHVVLLVRVCELGAELVHIIIVVVIEVVETPDREVFQRW